jgi:hypothetical protein
MKSVVGFNILIENPSGALLRDRILKNANIKCHKILTLTPYETINAYNVSVRFAVADKLCLYMNLYGKS